jgi:hypothetical protein
VGFVIAGLLFFYLSRRKTNQNETLMSAAAWVAFVCATMIIGFAIAYCRTGLIDTANNSQVNDPNISLYFSIVTWTTLGYGDFRPTPAARPFAAAEAIVGYLAMVMAIGYVALFLRRASD